MPLSSPPAWLPLAALLAIIAVSALRVVGVARAHKVKALSFGRHALIQVRIEEEALREKHGDAYERHAAQVGRWFGRRVGRQGAAA
ncbi:MAG: hypothetical protein K2P58_05885 [Hyphomonadaceae bacterium]|nr:hypothetical protein [Hyphomonadaceae bacterium]